MQGKATVVLIALLALGCDALSGGGKSKDDDKKESTKEKKDVSGDTRPAASKQADVKPSAVVTDPSQQTYPEDGINKIADSCATAFALCSTAPNAAGEDYDWMWTRQALLANQQFKVVDGDPKGPGEVSFQLHLASDKFNKSYVLIARCTDGLTCNKLAAMLKGVIKDSAAQPVCGTLPMDLGPATFKKPVLGAASFDAQNPFKPGDVVSACARLQACTVAMDPPAKARKETIGLDCQKGPGSFKTDCAKKYPCAEVMKCLGG